jgi:hypothetical protein
LLELSIGWYESVLDFNIKAAPGYQGFGSGILKYPFTFSAYNNVPNTQLISPATGILQAESTHFVIASRDYTAFAIVINGKWHHFSKNSATGNYELSFAVPDDVDFIEIYAGKGGNSYHGLVRYAVSR